MFSLALSGGVCAKDSLAWPFLRAQNAWLLVLTRWASDWRGGAGFAPSPLPDEDDVAVLPASRRIAPEPIATADLGEETEGRLVSFTGVVVGEVFHDHLFGDELHVDDGSGAAKVFVHRSTGIDVDGIPWLRPGARITVIGLSSQFDALPELAPRFRGDLRRAN